MIEAVSSVISNAATARTIAVEAVASNAASSNFEADSSVARAPVAPYVSPHVSLDTTYDTAVIEIRDSETGDVLKQFPTRKALERRAVQAELQESSQSFRRTEATPTPSPEVSQQALESTTFQATAIAQQGGQVGVVNGAGVAEAQLAIAALSSGAQSGQGQSAAVNVTA